ncbi:tetraspanin-18-like [Gigantopelta aegis]|uniref:tetraspanin-18-like n=1 Tax=Gigantopelta aegis TaxID=1735272 RepID=UPI001B887549|nr:tetraspanin-18-like [Gigantopelta aegis]
MGCCADKGKSVIVSLNTTFMFLAIGILVVGLLMHFNAGLLSTILSYVTTMLKGQLDSLSQGSNVPSGLKIDVSAEDIENLLKDLIANMGIPLIGLGATLVVISGSGLFGGCCKSTVLLILYSLFLIVIIAAQAAFLYFFLTSGNVLHQKIQGAMKDTLKFENYDGINSTKITTKLWTAMMDKLDCCGLDGSEDFESTDWSNVTIRKTMKVPVACCKNISTAMEETINGNDPACAVTPTESISNYKQGCYQAMLDAIMKTDLGLGIFAGLFSLIFLIEVLLLSFAIAIIVDNTRGKSKVGPR